MLQFRHKLKKIKILLILAKCFVIGNASKQKIGLTTLDCISGKIICTIYLNNISLLTMENESNFYVLLFIEFWSKILFMKIGESGCEVITIDIVCELLPIILIFEDEKIKFLKSFSSSKTKFSLFDYSERFVDFFLKNNTIIVIQTSFEINSSKTSIPHEIILYNRKT